MESLYFFGSVFTVTQHLSHKFNWRTRPGPVPGLDRYPQDIVGLNYSDAHVDGCGKSVEVGVCREGLLGLK